MTLPFLNFNKLREIGSGPEDVIPVIVQNASTNEVLTLAYTNLVALQDTITSGIATFWSTSRNERWIKGATSGNYLSVIEINYNCDLNSLLYRVAPKGSGVCHVINPETGRHHSTCFYRTLPPTSI